MNPENENLNKAINFVDKILNFNEKQKGKRLKILSPKQIVHRLTKVLAQVKADNTSKNLLNEIHQIIYSL